MINAIELKDLRNPEYLQFIKDTLGLVEINNPRALQVEPQFEALQNKYQECDALFKLPLVNERTQGLTILDAKRDKAITGISQVVTGYLNYFTRTLASAANLLHKNIRLYGDAIYRQSYQAQSATISSMINDWSTNSELTNAVTALNLIDWKEDLNNTNNEFIALYSQRTQDLGAQPTDNLLEKRTETNASYYAMKAMLEARKLIASDNTYDKVFADLNASIEQYNTLINNRKARNKNNKNANATDPTDI